MRSRNADAPKTSPVVTASATSPMASSQFLFRAVTLARVPCNHSRPLSSATPYPFEWRNRAGRTVLVRLTGTPERWLFFSGAPFRHGIGECETGYAEFRPGGTCD